MPPPPSVEDKPFYAPVINLYMCERDLRRDNMYHSIIYIYSHGSTFAFSSPGSRLRMRRGIAVVSFSPGASVVMPEASVNVMVIRATTTYGLQMKIFEW